MPIVGQPYVNVEAESEVRRGGANVEVALALDVTGSMNATRIDGLKAASKILIDEVVSTAQEPFYSRVAIVPWAQSVNLANGSQRLCDLDGAGGAARRHPRRDEHHRRELAQWFDTRPRRSRRPAGAPIPARPSPTSPGSNGAALTTCQRASPRPTATTAIRIQTRRSTGVFERRHGDHHRRQWQLLRPQRQHVQGRGQDARSSP